ncbi:MAG: PEP-CTERM sorting domain-containing protein [Pirellulales bacterium]
MNRSRAALTVSFFSIPTGLVYWLMTRSLLSRQLGALVLLCCCTVSNAAIIKVEVTGNGVLENLFAEVESLGISTLTFTYDEEDFTLSSIQTFPGGTGRRFEANTPVPLILGGGALGLSAGTMSGASIFESTTNDQFNFSRGGGIMMQWNDLNNSTFVSPLPNTFAAASSLFRDRVANIPTFHLANGGVYLDEIDGDFEKALTIHNAVVTFTVVPEASSFVLAALGLIGLVACRRRGRARRWGACGAI